MFVCVIVCDTESSTVAGPGLELGCRATGKEFINFRPQVLAVSVSACVFFKEIYWTDSIYSVYKTKLHNCSCNQFE